MQFVIGDEFLEKFLNIKMLKFKYICKDASTLNELFKVRRLYLYILWFDNNITNNSKGGYSNEKICFKKFVSYYNCFNDFLDL